jgi:hypothetical protein
MRPVQRALTSTLITLLLSACATTPPQQCDLAQPAGTCEVDIQFQRGKTMACSSKPVASTPPVCMSATIDLTNSRGYASRKLLLAPGECRTLGTGISSAAQSSCSAFALRPNAN